MRLVELVELIGKGLDGALGIGLDEQIELRDLTLGGPGQERRQ